MKVIILGNGGHAISCLNLITNIRKIKFMGFCEKKNISNSNNNFFTEKQILSNPKKFRYLINGVGHIKNNNTRKRLFYKFKNKGFEFPPIISQNSIVSKNSNIQEGTQIFHHVIINSNTHIGTNCIINNKSLIEHDVKIGNNCHISTGVIINGSVEIGDDCFIGSGSIIANNVKIQSNTFLKMGSLIKK